EGEERVQHHLSKSEPIRSPMRGMKVQPKIRMITIAPKIISPRPRPNMSGRGLVVGGLDLGGGTLRRGLARLFLADDLFVVFLLLFLLRDGLLLLGSGR